MTAGAAGWEADALALFAAGLAPSEVAVRLGVGEEDARQAVVRDWKRKRIEEKRRSWREGVLACGKEAAQ